MPFTPEFLSFVDRLGSRPGLSGLGRGLCAAALALLHAVLLVALAGMAVLPHVADRFLRLEASRSLGRGVSAESIRFNPFTFELFVTGFSVADKDGPGQLAGFSRLELDVDPSALLARRFTLRRLVLQDPALHLSRDASGRSNLADLFPDPPAQESSGSLNLAVLPPHLRFSLSGVRITGGSVSFDDAVTGNRHEARDLSFTIDSLASDRPGLNEFFTTQGQLNESSLTLTVKGSLAGPVTELEARLDLKDVVFRHYTPYLLPLKRPLDMRVEQAGARLRAVLPGDGAGSPRLEGAARVSGMSLEDQGGRVAGFEYLEVQGFSADLASGGAGVERVELAAPFLRVTRSEAGAISLLELLESEPVKAPGPAQPGRRPAFTVGEVRVTGGRVEAKDRGSGIETALERVEVSLAALDLAASRFESLRAEARGDRFERVTLTSRGGYAPVAIVVEGSVEGVDLSKPLPVMERFWPGMKPSGLASCSFGLDIGEEGGLIRPRIKADLEVRDLRVQAAGMSRPLAAASRLGVKSASVDPASRKVSVELVSFEGGGAYLERSVAGTLAGLPPVPAKGEEAGARPWDVSVAKAQLAKFSVEYRDAKAGAGLKADLDDVTLANASSDLTRPVTVSAKGRAGQSAAFDVSGEVRPGGLDMALKLSLRGLPLTELAKLGPPLPVRLLSGEASLSGQLSASLGKGGLAGSFTGDAGAALLRLARPGEDRPFCSATAVEARQVRVNLSPLEFSAASLLVDEPWIGLALDGQGRPVAPLALAASGESKAPAPAPAWRLERLDVRRGWVEVAGPDFNPHLSVLLSGIEASLSGARAGQAAGFSLEMAAGHTGRLSAKGEAGWVDGAALLDFKATLKNMDLGEFSPLCRRLTGFPIMRGMLGLVLDYKATPKALDLKNKIVVTGMRLGSKSPDALMKDVPLDLAVSLLTDAKGVIDLDIPVTGDPARARADLKDVISTAMAGAFAKVLFSPLAFLNVRGGEGQAVYAPFAPGSADLTDDARKNLASLAEAVASRPRLSLEVAAYVDPASEAQAVAKALSSPPGALSGKTAMLARPGVSAPGEPVEPGPSDWARLARLRQDAVLEFLTGAGKLPQERVFPLAVDTGKPPEAKGQPGHRAEVRLRY